MDTSKERSAMKYVIVCGSNKRGQEKEGRDKKGFGWARIPLCVICGFLKYVVTSYKKTTQGSRKREHKEWQQKKR
jgi:hypothetical protein